MHLRPNLACDAKEPGFAQSTETNYSKYNEASESKVSWVRFSFYIQGLYNFEALPPTRQTTSILPVELEIRNLLQPLQKEHEIQT